MIKKLFITIGILLLVAVTYLLFNTFTFSSKQLHLSTKQTIAVSDSSISRLQKAISFKTVSYDDSTKFDSTAFIGFHQFLTQAFPKIFQKLTIEKVNKYSLILHWKGKSSGNPLVMMAHQDVVPVEEGTLNQWAVAPFKGEIKNGFVYGRGAVDDKGSLMAILESLELLLGEGFQPEKDIYFAFGHDEEATGRKGAKTIASLFEKRKIKPAMVLDEGGLITSTKVPGISKPIALVGIAEKGYLTLDLKVNIPGGHSSMPEKETAIDELAKAIVKLKENPFPAESSYVLNSFLDYVGPEMPFVSKMAAANRSIFKSLIFSSYSKSGGGNATIRTTTATTIMKAGEKENVIPGQATATVNFRLLPGTSENDVITYVKKVINNEKVTITSRKGGSFPTQVADVNEAGFKYLQTTLSGFQKDLIVAPYLVLGATDGRYFGGLTSNVFRFTPFVDLEGFHGINERIKIEDYKKGIGFYYEFLKGYRL